MKKTLIALFVLLTLINGVMVYRYFSQEETTPPPPVQETAPENPVTPIPEPNKPENYTVSPLPVEYINYSQIMDLMKKWNSEAPEITEFGEYGKTSKGTPLTYLRIGTPGQPKVCIHAGIHGNERLSMAATMWMMQKMLHEYGRDVAITKLVETRDVYWIPVLSPDTHLSSRHVEGRDPNRDYPYPGRRQHTPTSPIQGIMDFCNKMHFTGVISGHTYGTVYFWPSIGPSQDQDAHKKLAREMGDKSGYRSSRISSSPNGYEIDWYYWTGAVAILTEFGSGTHSQSTAAITEHGQKNYPAYMHFIEQAPILQKSLSPPGQRATISPVTDPIIPTYEEEEWWRD